MKLDWRQEKAIVEAALQQVLPGLKRPIMMVPLSQRIHAITHMPDARIRQILGWLARGGHPNATQDGGTVYSYGRPVTRWRWHPEPQRAIPAGESAVDAGDW